MGDHPWVGKPFRYVTSHLRQLSLLSLHEHRLIWLGLRQGVFTCVGWQVCDPIWQVAPQSCEMEFHWQLYRTFNLYCMANFYYYHYYYYLL